MLSNYKLKSGALVIVFWISILLISFTSLLYLALSPELILDWYLYLATFNLLMSILAIYFIWYNAKKVKQSFKNEAIGFKFAGTFVKSLAFLIILPFVYFYIFSFGFIRDSLNSAEEQFNDFNNKVSNEVDVIYEMTQKAKIENYLNQTINTAKLLLRYTNLINLNKQEMQRLLDQLIKDDWACELILYDDNMNIIVSSKSQNICAEAESDFKADNGDYILVAKYNAKSLIEDLDRRMMIFRDAAKKASLELSYSIIQKRFVIDLVTTILLGLVASLLLVIRSIERLILPMQDLSLATKEISKGNYDFEIKNYPKNTDLEDLILSFNNMSKKIKDYREVLKTDNLYLETILKYSAGVISLNSNKEVKIINPIILRMLYIKDKKQFIGNNYKKIASKYKYLKPLILCIEKNINPNIREWREQIEIILPDRNILLYCQGASLDIENNNLGYLIVVNDISKLHRAQKKAAWGDIAVRMAHEIKNPLTPIILSAQRLRDLFLSKLNDKDSAILDKTTNTIIDQANNMSSMVSSFADYSNIPEIERKPVFLNAIINKVVALYDAQNDVDIELNLAGELPKLYLDESAISRVLINVIKNSIEAINKKRKLTIAINTQIDYDNNVVVMTIVDNGDGFDKDLVDKIFEPYITTKSKSGGLGLAIVQNIIDQHEGYIYASNIKPNGAKIKIEFSIIGNS